MSARRRAVKFHVSANVADPVLSRHADDRNNEADDDDDDDDNDENENENDNSDNDSLDDLPVVSADTLDKLIASYESLMVVGALLAGFAISLLPNVVERKPAADAVAALAPPNLWLSAARLCLFLVISCNFFAICALSLANFYLSQLWEKRRLRVVHFRVMTQSYRQLAHHAIVASIPLFATGVALWAAHHWRPFAPGALWNSPFEILALLVLLATIGAVVATIHVHRNAFIHTLLAKTPARRRLPAGRRDVSTGGSLLAEPLRASHPAAASSTTTSSRRTKSSSVAPGVAMSMASAAAAAAAAADIDEGASGGAIKRFHTKYF